MNQEARGLSMSLHQHILESIDQLPPATISGLTDILDSQTIEGFRDQLWHFASGLLASGRIELQSWKDAWCLYVHTQAFYALENADGADRFTRSLALRPLDPDTVDRVVDRLDELRVCGPDSDEIRFLRELSGTTAPPGTREPLKASA